MSTAYAVFNRVNTDPILSHRSQEIHEAVVILRAVLDQSKVHVLAGQEPVYAE